MRHSLAPNVDESHKEQFSEDHKAEQTTKQDASNEERNQKPEEISIWISRKDLSLNLTNCDICEIDIEDKPEVELPHEHHGCHRSPQVQLEEGGIEWVDKSEGWDQSDGDQEGQNCTGC